MFVQAYLRDAIENVTLMEIQEVIDLQRKYIEQEMEDYEYPNGKYGLNVR